MSEEEWIKELMVPQAMYPGLRDLRIQFITLLEFDLMVGPIAHILEIQRGSSYIKKLKDFQTLSEVYAGVARSPQHTLSTLEEDIAIFRLQTEGNTDINTVLFISCIPNSNMDPIRELGQKALFRSKGNPALIGSEISKILREQFQTDKMVSRAESDKSLLIIDENRVNQSIDYEYIQGFMILDIESKMADLRNLPRFVGDIELKAKKIVNFFDYQISNIFDDSSTSFWYQNLPFLATKAKKHHIYVIVIMQSFDFDVINRFTKWFIPLSNNIGHEWKQASPFEMLSVFSIFDEITKRESPFDTLGSYTKILIRNQRIRPNRIIHQNSNIDRPDYIKKHIWDKMMKLDGSVSLDLVAKDWELNFIELITIFEWARARNLIEFLQE